MRFAASSFTKSICTCAGAMLLLGGCASDQQQSRSQAKGVQQTVDHSPAPTDLHFQTGSNRPPTSGTMHAYSQLLMAQGNNAKAELLLRKIIADEPRFMPAYCDLAELQMRQRKFEDARRTLTAGLTVSPKDVVLLNDRGMCYLLQRDYPSALQDFSRAASIAPDDARYRSNMAMALAMMGRYDESFALYRQIMTLADAQHNIAVLRAARNDPKPAAEVGTVVESRPQVATVVVSGPAPLIQIPAPAIKDPVRQEAIQAVAVADDASDETFGPAGAATTPFETSNAVATAEEVTEISDLLEESIDYPAPVDQLVETVEAIEDVPVIEIAAVEEATDILPTELEPSKSLEEPIDNSTSITQSVETVEAIENARAIEIAALTLEQSQMTVDDLDDQNGSSAVESTSLAYADAASNDDNDIVPIEFHEYEDLSNEYIDDEPAPVVAVPVEVQPKQDDAADVNISDVAESDDVDAVDEVATAR